MGTVRLYLALTVVLAHLGVRSSFIDGSYAVHLFFIISGFFMGLVLNEKYTERSPKRFYIARYLRLCPTYIVTLALVFCFAPLPDFSGQPLYVAWYFWAATISLLGIETLWWFVLSPQGGIQMLEGQRGHGELSHLNHMDQMWSVGIELIFYIFAPLFAKSALRSAVIFVVSFLIYRNSGPLIAAYPGVIRNVSYFMYLFAAGVCAYHAYAFARERMTIVAEWPLTITLGVLTFIFLFSSFVRTSANVHDAISFVFVMLVPVLFHATRTLNMDRALGELSYPLYVIHYPIIHVAFAGYRFSEWPAILTAIAASLLAAFIMHIVIVRPLDKWRSTIIPAARRGAAASRAISGEVTSATASSVY